MSLLGEYCDQSFKGSQPYEAVHSSTLSAGHVLTIRSTGTPTFNARWAPTETQDRAIRLWVLLDQLQTSDTLVQAYERSRKLMKAT